MTDVRKDLERLVRIAHRITIDETGRMRFYRGSWVIISYGLEEKDA